MCKLQATGMAAGQAPLYTERGGIHKPEGYSDSRRTGLVGTTPDSNQIIAVAANSLFPYSLTHTPCHSSVSRCSVLYQSRVSDIYWLILPGVQELIQVRVLNRHHLHPMHV